MNAAVAGRDAASKERVAPFQGRLRGLARAGAGSGRGGDVQDPSLARRLRAVLSRFRGAT